MASFNKVLLAGNLTRDPEVRYIPSGVAVADIAVAVNERFKGQDGQWSEKPVYIDVVVWDRQAENCGKFLSKGSPVLIEGRLQLDQWESKEGEKRSKLRVRADRVQFLGSPREGGSPSNAEAGASESSTMGSAAGSSGTSRVTPPPPDDDEDDLPF